MSPSFYKSNWAIAPLAAIGMALLFVLVGAKNPHFPLLLGLMGLGVAGIVIGLWHRKANLRLSQANLTLITETLRIGSQERGEIVFAPNPGLRSPKLFLTPMDCGCPPVVDEIWIRGTSALSSPQDIRRWRDGMNYPELLVDALHPLSLVLRNPGKTACTVIARLVAKKEDPHGY